jgi:hypothetical protein
MCANSIRGESSACMDTFLTDLAKPKVVETKYKIGEAVGMQIVKKIYINTLIQLLIFIFSNNQLIKSFRIESFTVLILI